MEGHLYWWGPGTGGPTHDVPFPGTPTSRLPDVPQTHNHSSCGPGTVDPTPRELSRSSDPDKDGWPGSCMVGPAVLVSVVSQSSDGTEKRRRWDRTEGK